MYSSVVVNYPRMGLRRAEIALTHMLQTLGRFCIENIIAQQKQSTEILLRVNSFKNKFLITDRNLFFIQIMPLSKNAVFSQINFWKRNFDNLLIKHHSCYHTIYQLYFVYRKVSRLPTYILWHFHFRKLAFVTNIY